MTTMYGIPNCDTIKKAKKWLTENQIEFEFYDYKKQAPNTAILAKAISQQGQDKVVNKRGITYRKLDDAAKQQLDGVQAIDVLVEHASVIKRPIIEFNGATIVGFSPSAYKEFFNLA